MKKREDLILYDVSLRDGLQSISRVYTLDEKKEILDEIIRKNMSKKIEVGSLVSYKLIPQMKESIDVYKYGIKKYKDVKLYLLIGNYKKLEEAIIDGVKNMSFIVSFSDSFQKKNTMKNKKESKEELIKISNKLKDKGLKENKLYISCYNKCPIEGKIEDKVIMEDLEEYDNIYCIEEICLSDSMGNISYEDIKGLLNKIKLKIDIKKISLHLHYREGKINEIKKIIKYAISIGINKYDVSNIEGGGCIVSIDKKDLSKNINYNMIEE